MSEGVALDVDPGVGHLADLLPRQRVRGLADDVRINEDRERKFALLQLREGLGVGAAPAVVDGDDHRVLRQRGALAGHVLVDVAQRHDVVAGHLQVAELLAERLAVDVHPRRRRRLDDVVAEHRGRRTFLGSPARGSGGDEGEEDEDRNR
jgi:hypothetical protein